MRFSLILFFIFTLLANAGHYQLGHGVKLHEKLRIGGYFSTDYEVSETRRRARLDDVAVLAYGNITHELSYLAELEAAPYFQRDFRAGTQAYDRHFHKERVYFDYRYSEMANFRLGKQITPIGYWNLEPINVLRETSSNPLLSSKMFPKFLTGLDIYGYLPWFDSLTYHLFMQNNKDIDADYINIKNEHFFGISLENEDSMDFQYGGSFGEFITEDRKRTHFAQLNAKYEFSNLSLQSEVALNHIDDHASTVKGYKFASYLQSHYRISSKHALVGRYEYFHDDAINMSDHIGIFGYSYRPIYPVSLKAEYQWNSDEKLNKFITSFSVLF